MAVSKEEIVNFLQANPNMSDADIASAMAQYGVTPAQMAAATGLSEGQVISRVAATVPQGSSITLGDTRIVPSYQVIGSGEDQQIGALENIFVDKTTGDLNYKAPVGSTYQQLSADGTFERTGVTQKTASFLGGLGEMLNDPFVQAILLGGGVGGAIGGSLGLTGSTAQAVGTGLFKGGSALAGGAELEDALKAGLLSGGLVYGGNLIKNLDVPVDFNNMTAEEIDDALKQNFVKDLKNAGVKNTNEFITNQGGNAATYIQESVAATDLANNLANQGLNNSEIAQLLESSGVSSTAITDALDSLPVNTSGLLSSTVTTPISNGGVVDVTGLANQNLTTNNLLNNLVPTTTVTKGGTVEVAGNKVPEQVDQSVLDLINSQLATNVTTPANLANVEVTGDKTTNATDALTTLLSTLTPTGSTSSVPTLGNVEITGNRGITSGDTSATDIISLLAGTPPTTAPIITTPIVDVVGQRPVEPVVIDKPIIEPLRPIEPIQNTIIEPKLPVNTNIAEQVIVGDKPINITDLIASLVQPITSTPTVNVVGQIPIEPTIIDKPIIEPKPTVDEVVIKDNKPTITIEDILGVLTNTLPTPPTTPAEVVIKDQKSVPPLLPPIIVEPPQKPIIEPLRPVEPTIIDKPIIEPNTPVKPTIAEQVITGDKTINLNDLLASLIQPIISTPTIKVVDKKPVEPTIVDKPIIEPKPPVEPDPLKVIQDTAKIVNLLNTDTGTNQTVTTTDTGFPIVPIPADWTNPSATGVAPFTPLPPIDFGTRELLRGTQWEKFLSPTYGQVPEPVKFTQPSNMSYSDLMSILGGNKMPTRSNLSINDIISGIQNQYGQASSSKVG